MKYLLMLFFYVCTCAASNGENKLPEKQPSALFLSSAYLEDHPTFESLISAQILDDCNILDKAHKKFKSINDIEIAKRTINNGKFPLSSGVKINIAGILCDHFDNNQDAIVCLDNYAEKFALHPLSIEKIKQIMLEGRITEFDYGQQTERLKVLANYAVSICDDSENWN